MSDHQIDEVHDVVYDLEGQVPSSANLIQGLGGDPDLASGSGMSRRKSQNAPATKHMSGSHARELDSNIPEDIEMQEQQFSQEEIEVQDELEEQI